MIQYDGAFTGLEAAIVMIAFVVVAAVFGISVLSSGFYASEETKETTVAGYKQASSTIYIEGGVYATLSNTTNALDKVWFAGAIPETGQPQDLSKMIIVYTHSKETNKFREYTYGGEFETDEKFGVDGGPVMLPGDKRIFRLGGVDGPIPGGWFTIEVKPQMGAPTFVTYHLPDTFTGGSVLT